MTENNTNNTVDIINNTEPNPTYVGIYITINYVIAVITALIVIVMLIGTILNKKSHCYLKTIHIQFFITALMSCVYHFLNRKPVHCRAILSFEIFTTFPVVSQLTCMLLCTYLMFKEEFETRKTKVYVFSFIFVNWLPTLGLHAFLNDDNFMVSEKREFFCRFFRNSKLYIVFWVLTGIFQFYFDLIMFFLYRKLKQLKSTGDMEVLSKIYKKIGIQFICEFLYSIVMWFYVFSKRTEREPKDGQAHLGEAWYYFSGVLYNLSTPILCFIFIWSSNLRDSISQIPCFGWLAERQIQQEPMI